MPTGSVGELKEEKRGSVASRCRRAALTCLSPQQSRTVRSGQELRRRPQTAETSLSPLPSEIFPPPQAPSSVFHSSPPAHSLFPSFRFSLVAPAISQKFARPFADRSVDSLERGIEKFSAFSGRDDLLPEDRVSRDGEVEDAPVAGVGDGGLAAAAVVVVMVVVVVVVVVVVLLLVPVKKRKKKRKKKTAHVGGGSSLLPRTPAGGGKATLKDRGDVVLAGTRRVFVHVARKENFSTSRLRHT